MKGSQLSSSGRKIDLGDHFQRQKVKGEGISNNKMYGSSRRGIDSNKINFGQVESDYGAR